MSDGYTQNCKAIACSKLSASPHLPFPVLSRLSSDYPSTPARSGIQAFSAACTIHGTIASITNTISNG